MSILIIGDLHIKVSNERQTTIAQNDIIRIIKDRPKIKFVVILGDTLDNHEKINMRCLNRAADLFEAIIATGKHLFVLIGNHDRENNKDYMTNIHPFRGFENREGITIISKCYTYKVNSKELGINGDNDFSFCFVPFVPDGTYMDALKDCNINISEITMFFSHSEFDGCKINKVSKNKCDIWPHDYPLNISGHIHEEEVVQDNLIYVGTPFQHNYNDSPDKGIFILDLTKDDLELEKIKLGIPPKIIQKIHYTDLEKITINPDTDVRLVIYGPTSHVKELMKRPDMVKKFANVQKRYKDEDNKNKDKSKYLNVEKNQQFYQQLLSEVEKDEKLKFTYQYLLNKK